MPTEQKVKRTFEYGPAALRPVEILEGRDYYSTDAIPGHTLDTDNQRLNLAPQLDWNETNPDKPSFVKNKPDIDSILHEIDSIRRLQNDTHIYGVVWDKTSSAMERLYDAADITTDTTNFVYSGSVNANYDNPFDDIYPWSECKQCNVDLTLYRAQTAGDDIRDAVVAWCGDPDFKTDGSNGFVGRYTPEFWYNGYEKDGKKYIFVADKEVFGFYHHKASIRGHGFCVDDGNNGVTCDDGQPLAGSDISIANVHTKAKNSGFTLMNIYERDAEVALYCVEFADYNAQDNLGNGCSNLYSTPNFKCTQAATGATSVLAPKTVQANCIPGAALWLSSTNGSGAAGDVRTITSVEDYDSTYCKINFTPAKDLTTSTYVSVMGKNNADSIGNKSGYVGINGKNNSWYRGAIMYGNRWQYTLACYRQTGTNHLWLCPESECDNYDMIDTANHIDTGITIYTPSSGSWQDVGDITIPHGLSSFGPMTKAASITGDQQYCAATTNLNAVALLGGIAYFGAICGVLCAGWNFGAGNSRWDFSSIPLLKSK